MADLVPPNIGHSVQSFYNASLATTSDLDLFYKCWVIQSCETCLASRYPCSWCATSQVCVPNTRTKFPFQILAPIKYDDICPLAWYERWEMRAKPFSCRCSTMTFISVVVAVLFTLLGVLLIWLLINFVRWSAKRWKTRDRDWWNHRWTKLVRRRQVDDEQRTLLGGN